MTEGREPVNVAALKTAIESDDSLDFELLEPLKNEVYQHLVTDIFRVMDAFYEYQQVKLIGKIFIGFSKSSGIGMFQFALTEKDKAVILSLHNKLKTGISKMEEKAAAATKTGADGTPTEKKTTA